MGDDGYTFEQTKLRLEEILAQVKKKDTSLEQSLELLEEGVRLANRCNELIDQTSWRSSETADDAGTGEGAGPDAGPDAEEGDGQPVAVAETGGPVGHAGPPDGGDIGPEVPEVVTGKDEGFPDDERE